MDPSDPLRLVRGRTEWALVAAVLVPLLLVGLLIPSRPSPELLGTGETPTAAAERPTEPPTALLAPPATARMRRLVAARATPHRTKSDAFDAAFERALAAQSAALDQAAPRLAHLELTLRDATTRDALPGAAVELARDGQHRRMRADERGVLALDLPPGPLVVVAWTEQSTAGPIGIELAEEDTAEAELLLQRSVVVAGRVTDAQTGLAIPHASVAFWTHSELDRVRTDDHGRFRHPRFPVHAPQQQVRIEAHGYAPAVRYLELDEANAWVHRGAHAGEQDASGSCLPAIVNVVLQPALALEGRVLDPDGRPIGGALVTATGYARLLPDVATRDEASRTTNAEGLFRLDGLRPDVSHALHVSAAGSAELVLEVPPLAGCNSNALLEGGRTVALGDLRLDAPALVAGVLIDAAGEPVVDAEVQLRRLDLIAPSPTTPADPGARPLLASHTVRTDTLGAFLFEDLAPGRYQVRARRDRGTLVSQELDLARAEERADLRLSPREATWTLRGVLRTPTGPLADAAIEIERFGAVARLRTDRDGRFQLAGLDDVATYTIRAAEAGFTPAEVPAWAWEPVALEVTAELPSATLARNDRR